MENLRDDIAVFINNEDKYVGLVDINQERFVLKRFFRHDNKHVYESMMQIRSPYIPIIYEVNDVEGGFEVIEEYIEGTNLKRISQELSNNEIMNYSVQLCEGLEALHEKQVIHCDLRPENILTRNGKVKIIDFSSARHKSFGGNHNPSTLGKLGYVAPEQQGYSFSDERSDLYAVGNIINEMFTGKVVSEELVENKLTPLILKCTHTIPENRYKNTKELHADLIKIRDNRGKYTLPGFRTGNQLNKVIAVAGYAFIVYITFISDPDNVKSTIDLIVLKSTIFWLFTSLVITCTNYLDVQRLIPHKRFKLIGAIATRRFCPPYCLYSLWASLSLLLEDKNRK